MADRERGRMARRVARAGGWSRGWLLALALAAPCGCVLAGALPPVDDLASSDDARARYFRGRATDPVEGIWRRMEGTEEVAVTRNTFGADPDYAYVAIVTAGAERGWRPGQVRMLLAPTADPDVFTGLYRRAGTAGFPATFRLAADGDLLGVRVETGGGAARFHFLRVRPAP